ncbi:hypothetical protein BGZ60DRAFT_424068 [Tricladium varicosporioides]|nr:hypothetical protein BGZ60DRAFT_424068 [Hymenoscyphus varicosporioides]
MLGFLTFSLSLSLGTLVVFLVSIVLSNWSPRTSRNDVDITQSHLLQIFYLGHRFPTPLPSFVDKVADLLKMSRFNTELVANMTASMKVIDVEVGNRRPLSPIHLLADRKCG